jgi:DNA-binding HxlR family transcriptional regulator
MSKRIGPSSRAESGGKYAVFTTLLRKLSKKGFYAIFLFVEETGESGVHYNDVLRYALSHTVVESRASVTAALNALTGLKLLERTVSVERPVRTIYTTTKKGKIVTQHLKEIEKEIS